VTEESLITQPAPGAAPTTRPYAPSWVDYVIAGIQRLPGPSWLYYLGLWLLLFLLANAVKWADGSQPLGTIEPLWALRVVQGVYFLALMHYLKGVAGRALQTFRPALGVSEDEYARLHYQLTTLPAWPALLVSGLGLAIAIWFVLSEPAPTDYVTSPLAAAFDGVSLALVLAPLGAMLHHTVHQIRTVSRIHAAATRIDLFQPDPLHAFSGLAARTVGGYILIMDPTILYLLGFMPEEMSDPRTLGVLAFMTLLLAVSFFLPLLGMHQRMEEEKTRLQTEANRRLEATIAELHRRIDAGDTASFTELQRGMTALEIEREALAGIPTWPWQPGTLRLVISALLFPVVVWSIQRVLEYLAGL